MTEPDPLANPGTMPTLEVRPLRPLAAGHLPLIDSAQLFCQGSSVRIGHGDQFYLLRVTRENKLILTK